MIIKIQKMHFLRLFKQFLYKVKEKININDKWSENIFKDLFNLAKPELSCYAPSNPKN